MNKTCPKCSRVDFKGAESCSYCGSGFPTGDGLRVSPEGKNSTLKKRLSILAVVCVAVVLGFYLSLIVSAKRLAPAEKATVRESIQLLKDKGFQNEVFMLENLTTFRGSDNWLNASVAKENAYAATNFPFEIMTLYPDFFTYPADATERAAILLHEARHLLGDDEHEAYKYVWENRKRLQWTIETYAGSPVWTNVRRQTRDAAPELFVCTDKDYNDCTD